MSAVRTLRLGVGDIVVKATQDGTRILLQVRKRTRAGYVLRRTDGGEERLWKHEDLWDGYCAGELELRSKDTLSLGSKQQAMLDAGFESWSAARQFSGFMKKVYCEYSEKLIARGVTEEKADERAARTVFRMNEAAWTLTSERLEALAVQRKEGKARKAVPVIAERKAVKLRPPAAATIAVWRRMLRAAGDDWSVLIPRYHDRGNRKPRMECKLDLQTDFGRPLCVYGAMAYVTETVYLNAPRATKTKAHRELKLLCAREGFESVSLTTLSKFIDSHYSAFEQHVARWGWKSAFYKFRLFSRRRAPERLLEQVEVDHTLLDVFVKDEKGRVGRPWLTLLLDRASRCVIGFHIGFEPPSWATLQRALIHAMCPKDLTGLGLKNDWRCHGVMMARIADQGLDLRCDSLDAATSLLGFEVVNVRGGCPHLKGMIERFFGTLGIEVLSYLEGSTKARAPGFYDPQAEAKLTLADLTLRIVRWIVDEYHQRKHSYLGCSPARKWAELEREQGVPPIPSPLRLITVLGCRVRRTIQKTGITWNGHTYRSGELELLHKRVGAGKVWEIRCDPYDLGQVLVLDDTSLPPRWLAVPAVHRCGAQGLSVFQGRVHRMIARRLVGLGGPVTEEAVEEAIAVARTRAEQSSRPAAMRYDADGRFATPLQGARSLPSILDIPVPGEEDGVQGSPPRSGGNGKRRKSARPRRAGEPAASASIKRLEDLAA